MRIMDEELNFRDWLSAIGLEQYTDVLEENDIDFDVIMECSDDDLKELGIPLGGRKRLLKAIEEIGVNYSFGDDHEEVVVAEEASEVPPEEYWEEIPIKQTTVVHTPPTHAPAPTPPPAAVPATTGYDQGLMAQPSPLELIEKPDQPKGKRSRKATAIIVAIAVHAVLLLIATVLVILPPSKDEAEIIATLVSPNTSVKQEMQKKTVQKQVKRAPAAASAAAAPMAMMMKANAVAKFTAPDITKTSTGPLGMGEGDLGKGAFGAGTGLEGGAAGGGAAFFGSKSTGNRFLFVLDHSASMKSNQINLRNAELERALKSLKGAQYQVLLFAGAALYAQKGWKVQNPNHIVGPDKTDYKYTSKGAANFDFVGKPADLPREKWLPATPSNISRTMEFINNLKKFYGTDWGMALEIGHAIEPKPDVIFFMADGTGGNDPEPILEMNRKNGRPVINTVAMQTKSGAAQFAEVAKGTRGKYTIVDKDGKPIDGFDFLKNPKKYNDRL